MKILLAQINQVFLLKNKWVYYYNYSRGTETKDNEMSITNAKLKGLLGLAENEMFLFIFSEMK